jgi:hypothetical protein
MVKKVFCVLLVGIIFSSGLALAARVEKSIPADSPDADGRAIEAMAKDETYGVRDGEVYRFDAQRNGWTYKGQKAGIEIDTLRYFTAEPDTINGWLDKVTATRWDTVDTTTPALRPQDIWFHVDDVMVLSGDSAWWCGNPDLADSVSPPLLIPGGYTDLWYQSLTTPPIDLTDADSCFLIFEQFLKCEKKTDFPYLYSWDGYNVRVSTGGTGTEDFDEIYPYRLLVNNSFYRGRLFEEWDKLRCWEAHWDAPICHRDSVMGGFSGDQDTTWSVEIFDLRQFAGETIQIQFAFGTDWAMNTIDDGYGNIGDTTWHGLLLDDILVVEGMDSLALSTVFNVETYDPVALGGTQLFLETCETADMPHQMTPGYLAVGATGSYWGIDASGHSGLYMAMDGGSFTELYYPCMEDKIVAPKIARADLPSDLADLWLMYWLKGNVDDPDPIADGSDWTRNCFQLDGGEWYSISLLHGTISYIFQDYTNSEWMGMDRWSDDMRDLTPLLSDTFTIGTDTVTSWDTLRVGISFESDLDEVTAASKAFKVDDITITGRIGAQFDVGLSAVKLPWPNAVDQKHVIDSVAVTNYGFNVASEGQVQVYMEIKDTLDAVIFGPTQVALFPSPQIDPLETVMVPLDTTAKVELAAEGVYDFVMWTTWAPDTTSWNDSLKVEYSATKAWWYPYVYNYPAGQGQMRYHDNNFYTFPSVWRRVADTSEVCAVRFDVYDEFGGEPVDARLALFYFYQGGGQTYNLNVYDEGVDDDHPGAMLSQIQFTSTGGDSLDYVRIELDTVAALQHRNSNFWLGVDFGAGPDTLDGMTYEPFDPDIGANWGHSYFYTDTTGTKQFDWIKRELDWGLTCVISWRTVFPEAIRDAADSLYLDWASVNQAKDYLVYRSTHIDSPFPFLDSTAAATSEYYDPGVVGDVDTSYFYLFHTRHQDGGVYDKTSSAVGEFDKYLP